MARANPEFRKKIAERFLSYYKRMEVQKYILPYHFHRETALIGITNDKEYPYKKIRNLKLDDEKSFFYSIIRKFEVFKEPYNLYHSCASYRNGLPIFYYSGDSKETVKERQIQWLMCCSKQTESYDMSIDIDSPSFSKLKIAAQDTLRIANIISKRHEIEVRFTGCGFHIILKNYWKGTELKKKDMDKMKKFAEKYKNTQSELVDTHVIEPRRVIKTPHSLVYREGYRNIMKCEKMELVELQDFDQEAYIYEKLF